MLRSVFILILILSCAAFYSEAERGGKLDRGRRRSGYELERRTLLPLLRKRRGILFQPKQIYSKNPNILFDKRTLYLKKRDLGSSPSNRLSSAWQERQDQIDKLKGLAKLRARHDKSPGIYDSFFHKWLSSYTQGPTDRRMHVLDIGPQHRYGYPLSKSHGHRAQKELTGYYKELNVGGLMDKQ